MSTSDVGRSLDAFSYSDVLLDLSPSIVFFLAPDHSVYRMSKSAREAFKVKPGTDVTGTSIFDIIHNPVLTLLLRRWFEKLNRGNGVDEVFPLENPDTSSYLWYHVKAGNVDKDGIFLGSVFFLSDITESHSQKKILDTLMGALPGDVLVFTRSLRVLLVSDSIARECGFHGWRDAVGAHIHDLKRFDAAALEKMVDQLILSSEPIHDVIKVNREDGDVRWFLIDLRTIPSTAGTFGYILTRFDITGEIKPKAVLESLMDSATDSIVIVDPKGVIQYASRSLVETLGFSNWRMVIGHTWNFLFTYDSYAGEKFRELFSGPYNESRHGTLALDGSGGKTFFNYRIDPLRYQGENFGLITIANNATELISARNRAESAVRAKAAFLANMSHELRTPMNAVLGMNELLSRTSLSSLQKNYVGQIRSSATLLLSIINDILDFSRIEDRKMELSEAPYNLLAVLQDVINLVSVKVAEKELSFTVDVDPRLPAELAGDEIRIKQILINLLNNAVKFTNSGEINLTVSCGLSSGYSVPLSFAIRDTGIGIPKDKQTELFERFSRIERSSTQSIEGSGLGLSICKGLVHLMDGTLTVESDAGKGSVFTAVLHQKKTGKHDKIASFEGLKEVRLLAFDPDLPSIASIRKMAGYAGLSVRVCSTVQELSGELESSAVSWTHVVFEYRSAYELSSSLAGRYPAIRWLALLTLTDFIGTGRNPSIDFVFKPLLLPVFARFLRGEAVDFSVSLPMSSSLGISPGYFRANGVRVLVVDDNAVNRKVADGFLQTLDISCDEAASGEEALEKLHSADYDLVLLDHIMPGLDGIETLKRIRALPGREALPVVALTANTDSYWAKEFTKAGFNEVLCKPIDFNAFVVTLKRLIPETKRVSPEAPARKAPESDTDVPEWIAGLDKAQALAYTGNEKNLAMVIKVFNRTGQKLLDQLESGRYSGDQGRFRTAAHSLVSSCANIGAKEVSALAAELEEAILSGDNDGINRLYPLLHEKLGEVVRNVGKYVGGSQ